MKTTQDDSEVLKIGGVAGFDFMNTTYRWGKWVEVLNSPAALLHALVETALISEKDAKVIKRTFSARELSRLLTKGLELRARLRSFMIDFKKKGVSKTDVQYFNEILRRGRSGLEIEIREKSHIHLQPTHEWKSVDEVLAVIIESIMTTLSTEDFDLIKSCENPKCAIWFVDRTKAHRRKFCSQSICGNRAKQAAFRERQQE